MTDQIVGIDAYILSGMQFLSKTIWVFGGGGHKLNDILKSDIYGERGAHGKKQKKGFRCAVLLYFNKYIFIGSVSVLMLIS